MMASLQIPSDIVPSSALCAKRGIFQLLFLFLGFAVGQPCASGAEQIPRVTYQTLRGGAWEGSGTNDLSCKIVFAEKNAKIYTYRTNKHISTIRTWYSIDGRDQKINLGVSGEAIAISADKLKVYITPRSGVDVVPHGTILTRKKP